MNQYDEKLKELIKTANQDGYIYKNNKFYKLYKNRFHILHLVIISTKNNFIYNKCFVLLKDIVWEKIKEISNPNKLIAFMKTYLYRMDGFELSKIKSFKNIKEEDFYRLEYESKNIYNMETKMEAAFKNQEFFGFIHIFDCPYEAVDKFQNIKYYFEQ